MSDERCKECGDKLGHEEDAGNICRWCNEGWKPTTVSENEQCGFEVSPSSKGEL